MEPVVINASDLTDDEVKSLLEQGFAVEQGTEEWLSERLGLVTASNVFAVVARTARGLPYEAYHAYKMELVVERLTGRPKRFKKSGPMQWGSDYETEAAEVYEALTGYDVQDATFVRHETLAAGATPDKYVNEDGLLETKCPGTVKHLQYMLDDKPPINYYAQMQWQMFITGRKWCDFMSYDPWLEDRNLGVFVKRIERDEDYIKDMVHKVMVFLAEVEVLEDKLIAKAETAV